jgi:hypothetical protein
MVVDNKNIEAQEKTINDINVEIDSDVKKLFNSGVGIVADNNSHTVFDIVVALKSAMPTEFNLIMSISIKESKHDGGDTDDSFLLTVERVEKDVKAIENFEYKDIKKKKKKLSSLYNNTLS